MMIINYSHSEIVNVAAVGFIVVVIVLSNSHCWICYDHNYSYHFYNQDDHTRILYYNNWTGINVYQSNIHQ